MREVVARAIMEARPNGGCIVKDWQAEIDNPHVATALAQADAAISAMAPRFVQMGLDAAASQLVRAAGNLVKATDGREELRRERLAVVDAMEAVVEIRALSADEIATNANLAH